MTLQTCEGVGRLLRPHAHPLSGPLAAKVFPDPAAEVTGALETHPPPSPPLAHAHAGFP